jgi:hypothetical protein
VQLAYAQKPVAFDITYLSLDNEPLFGDRKEIYGNTSFDLAPHWTLNLGGRRDLGSSEEQPINTSLPVSELNPLEPTAGTVGLNSGLVYHTECIAITTLLNRSYITVGVTLVLKNFGALSGPPLLATAANITTINTDENPVNPAQTLTDPSHAGNGNSNGSKD